MCLSVGAAQASVIYDCEISNDQPGWIGDWLVIEYDVAAGIAAAHDWMIYSDNDGKPMRVLVNSDDATQTNFSWKVGPFEDDNNQLVSQFDMTATILKNQKHIRVLAKPKGFRNYFAGVGTCEVISK